MKLPKFCRPVWCSWLKSEFSARETMRVTDLWAVLSTVEPGQGVGVLGGGKNLFVPPLNTALGSHVDIQMALIFLTTSHVPGLCSVLNACVLGIIIFILQSKKPRFRDSRNKTEGFKFSLTRSHYWLHNAILFWQHSYSSLKSHLFNGAVKLDTNRQCNSTN